MRALEATKSIEAFRKAEITTQSHTALGDNPYHSQFSKEASARHLEAQYAAEQSNDISTSPSKKAQTPTASCPIAS
jgi:hypothetical protein